MTERDKIEWLLKAFYQNQGNLRGYVYSCTRNYHGAEEVMQAIAIKIAQSAIDFDMEREPMPWFLGIARNQVKQWYQKRQRDARFVSFEVLEDYLPNFGIFENEQVSPRRTALKNCMDKLPKKQKQVVELRYLESQNCGDIAGVMGRSVQSVYSLLKRLKTELRKCVEFQLQRSEVVR